MLRKYMLLLQSNAVEGREEAFNAWYDAQHVPDLLRIPGIVSAQRYVVSPLQNPPPPGTWQYVALYEIETDDLAATMQAIRARSGTQEMPLSDALGSDKVAFFLEPLGDRRKSD